MQARPISSLEEKEKINTGFVRKLQHEFANIFLHILIDPHEKTKAFNYQKSITKNGKPYDSFDANEVETALDSLDNNPDTTNAIYGINEDLNFPLKHYGFTEEEINSLNLSEGLICSAAITYAMDLLCSKYSHIEFTTSRQYITAFNLDIPKLIKAANNIKEINKNGALSVFKENYNNFIGFPSNLSLDTILSHLKTKETEEVKNFFADSKIFLRYSIYKNMQKIMQLYSNDKNNPGISILKGEIKRAENFYLGLKKIERAYSQESSLDKETGSAFLSAVKEINIYMKKRAKETRNFRFLSNFFGYSGQDYYDRRAHWETVMQALLDVKDDASLQNAFIVIYDGITHFGGKRRNDYAAKLADLSVQLGRTGPSVNKNRYANTYLKSSKKIYENLASISGSVNNYITNENKEAQVNSLSQFISGLSRHRLKTAGRTEFLTRDEVKETEFRNSVSGRYKNK